MHKRTKPLTKHSFSTESFLNCNSFILGKQQDSTIFLQNKQTYGQQGKCPPVTYLLDHREYVCVRRRSQSVEVRGYMLTSYVCLVWYMNLKTSNKSGLNKLHLLAIIEVSQMGEIGSSRPPPKKILYEFEFHIKNRHNAKLFRKIITIISGF